MKYFLIALSILIFCAIFVVYRNGYIFLPVDILNNFPLYGIEGWSRVDNSLLADPVFQFEPWRYFAKESLLQGILPFWNGSNGTGVPFLANPITEVFSPLNILYYLLPVGIALPLIAVAKIFLYGTFLYLYLRSNNVSKLPSYMGVLVALTGFFHVWILWPQTSSFLYFPLVLFSIDKFFSNYRYTYFLLLVTTLFFVFLGGHPETYFLVCLVSFLYIFLRFTHKVKNTFYFSLSVAASLSLSSFLLLPFLEYLLHSYALAYRSGPITPHVLPLGAILLNVFPFGFGAPHLNFYRPFAPGTNFQEVFGGYASLIAPIVIVSFLSQMIKNKLVIVWIGIIIISLLVGYQFPIISSLIGSSILNINANHRIVAFVNVGVAIVFAITLSKILRGEIAMPGKRLLMLFVVLLLFSLALFITAPYIELPGMTAYRDFSIFLLRHVATMISSTVLFFILLASRKRINSLIFSGGLMALLFYQAVIIIWNYNPLIPEKEYYPTPPIVAYLQSREGRVLNIGNPNFPPNINLIYGIENIESDDAVEIGSFKNSFNAAFFDRNHWKRVDSVQYDALKKFGVSYVLSDYDIRFQKMNINKGIDENYVLGDSLSASFRGQNKTLRQIRFVTANFNRANTCQIVITIENITSDQKIGEEEFSCATVKDRMFYTVNIDPVLLNRDSNYQITFLRKSGSIGSNIGIVGADNRPYLDLLFEQGSPQPYSKIMEQNRVYLFKVNDSDLIEGNVKYQIISNTDQNLELVAEASSSSHIIIKKTNYPGWQLYINGIKNSFESNQLFMHFELKKGLNHVEIMYKPISFYCGVVVTLVTFLVLFAIFIVRKSR